MNFRRNNNRHTQQPNEINGADFIEENMNQCKHLKLLITYNRNTGQNQRPQLVCCLYKADLPQY
jgi:hypothetical protein